MMNENRRNRVMENPNIFAYRKSEICGKPIAFVRTVVEASYDYLKINNLI
jgi:hypothetical protein